MVDGIDDKQYDLEQMSGIDALLYKSYKTFLLSKVRTKVEVNLGKYLHIFFINFFCTSHSSIHSICSQVFREKK